ncbi:MAG: DUF2550 domain-containing protein [Bifidobacteriaceae bacterium]|jgi:hypothetical protein|nr:DUF2550 domain-containing protein [Bifidobacteriaceae bacterium]
MPQALTVAVAAVVVAAVGLLGLVWLRWLFLRSRPGHFPCAVVEGEGADRRERLGVAAFGPGVLDWFARDSLRLAPTRRWARPGLTIKARPLEDGARSGWQVVNLTSNGVSCLLVISRGASAGLLSWIEAGPSRLDSPA